MLVTSTKPWLFKDQLQEKPCF